MVIKAVLFDMDGVIFDSERAVYRGWQEIAEKYGLTDLDTAYMKCIGVNAAAAKQIFLEHYGADFPYDAYKKEQSDNYHRKYDNGRLPMKPGVRELLTFLQEKSIRTAIASSTRTELVRKQIEDAGLLPFFDEIVGGDQVSRSKPAPDIFLKAAEKLKVPAEECCVIEDSYNGIRAAKAAGMIPVMIPDMLAPDEEMSETAAYIFENLEQAEKLFC